MPGGNAEAGGERAGSRVSPWSLAVGCSPPSTPVHSWVWTPSLRTWENGVARGGISKFARGGLPDAAGKESAERAAVALNSQGYLAEPSSQVTGAKLPCQRRSSENRCP
jgi:hypothetical protein